MTWQRRRVRNAGDGAARQLQPGPHNARPEKRGRKEKLGETRRARATHTYLLKHSKTAPNPSRLFGKVPQIEKIIRSRRPHFRRKLRCQRASVGHSDHRGMRRRLVLTVTCSCFRQKFSCCSGPGPRAKRASSEDKPDMLSKAFRGRFLNFLRTKTFLFCPRRFPCMSGNSKSLESTRGLHYHNHVSGNGLWCPVGRIGLSFAA